MANFAIPKAGSQGTVSRIVTGRVVYVDVPEPHGTVAVTPERIAVKDSKGVVRNYRGESFSELGIAVGVPVEIVRQGANGRRYIFEPSRRPGFFSRLAAPLMK